MDTMTKEEINKFLKDHKTKIYRLQFSIEDPEALSSRGEDKNLLVTMRKFVWSETDIETNIHIEALNRVFHVRKEFGDSLHKVLQNLGSLGYTLGFQKPEDDDNLIS